jgi:pyruvate-formate lyase-activating enzyme/glutaredoxin
MTNKIYTATGCSRCSIAKRYMADNAINYEEYDIKAEGKQAFSQFYRANRSKIYRSKDGVEFPVFTNGQTIRQGLGPIISYLIANGQLDGFISTGTLHGQWLDGIDISGGDPDQSEDLLHLLSFLKQNGLKLQMTTDGHNAKLFETIVNKDLCDRAIMAVRGPFDLYKYLSSSPIEETELINNLKLVSQCPEYQFFTTISVIPTSDGARYLTPDEVRRTSKTISDATGSKKHPYQIKRFDDTQLDDAAGQKLEPLQDTAMFKYRTAARRYMVMAEIEN